MVNPMDRKRHVMFVQSNWQSLSAECFNGYQTQGRGFLVIFDGAFIDKPVGIFCKFRCGYAAVGSEQYKTLTKGWELDSKELSWIPLYDPNTTCLFVFMRERDPGGVSSYRIEGQGDGIPVMCWNRERAKNN